MNILHICNDYSYSKVYKELYQEIDKRHICQFIYHPLRSKKNIGINQFEFITPSSKLIYSNFLIKKTDRIFFHLKTNKIYNDLVKQVNVNQINVCYPTTLFSDGVIAFKLFKDYGIPYVVSVRNTDVNLFLKYRRDLIPLMNKILNNASKIIFISEGLKNLFFNKKQLKKHKQNFLNKSILINNGINKFWFDNLYELNKNIKTKNLLFVGKFDKNKNLETLIKAIERLKENHKEIKLTVVGREGNNSRKIHELFNKHKSWITNLGYINDLNELKEIYRKNDYFVMPSKLETFGLVYIEALTQGLPILYTKNQGIDGLFCEKIGVPTYPHESSIEENLYSLLNTKSFEIHKVDFTKFSWEKICLDILKILHNYKK